MKFMHTSSDKTKKGKSMISRLFLILISLTVISIATIVSVWVFNVHQTITYLSEFYINDIVRSANSNFENDLYDTRSAVATMAGNTSVKQFLEQPDASKENLREYLLNNLSLFSENINGITVLSASNNLSVGAYFPPDADKTEWYKTVTEQTDKTVLLSRSEIYQNDNKAGIALAKAITAGNETIGIIVADLKENIITKHFGMNHMNGLLRTMILDSENNVIYTNASALSADTVSADELIKNYSAANKLTSIKINGEEYFVAAKKFSSSPDWLNITFCPTKTLYESYNQMLRLIITIIILVILVTLLLSMLSFYSTKKGFNQLSRHISTINLMDIDKVKSFTPSVNDSEIIMISDKINQLVHTISEQLTAINELEEKKRVDEIKILKAQINPHMIYNTLNVIQTTAEYQKNTKISEISKSLSMLLRYSVTDTDKLVTLSDEFEYIRGYLTLIQHKFVNDIQLEIVAEDSILSCMTLKMLMQPIVENSIKHGFKDKPGQYIIIKAYKNEDNIFIKITDNGLGIPPDKLSELLDPSPETASEHLGLNNINRRLKLTFGNRYGIEISSIPSVHTTVIIEIPYIPNTGKEQNEL